MDSSPFCCELPEHQLSQEDWRAESTSVIINQSSLQGTVVPWENLLLPCTGSLSSGRCPFYRFTKW